MNGNTNTVVWFAVALFAAAMLLPAAPTAEAATTTRTLEITEANTDPQVSYKGFDGNPTKVFDIDGDGDLEIIAQNDNQWVYVFDSKDGTLLAEAKTRFPQDWGARSFNGPEVTVLREGGDVRMILANSAAFLTSYKFDPAASTKSDFKFVKEWDVRLTDCHPNPGMDAKPVFADLDQDGDLEILAATEESGVYALRGDGSIMWKRCIGGGNGEPGIGDFNRDGFPDVVFGSDGGVVTAMDGRNGNTLWSQYIPHHFNVGAGSIPDGPAVAQLNGKGPVDVVFGVRDSHDANDFSNNHALLIAFGGLDGRILWGKQNPNANPLTYTHPIIVDAQGDGEPEVYWGDWNTMGHKPGNWEVTGPGNFYRYSAAGDLVWRQSLDTFWSNNDVALADVDGDGVQEMLANGPRSDGHDGIWYLDTETGAKETFVDLYPYKAQRGPIVADLWGTGTMQWVIQVAPYQGGGHGILVYDTGAAYDAAWPHLPYTSFDRGQTGDGGGDETPFDATVTVSENANEWWVEVYVDANEPVTAVDARVNGGSWVALEKQDWGSWAKSFHVEAGSQVEFRATSQDGDQDVSKTFTWLSDGGDTTAFDATFTVSDNANEWWVEVYVDANEPVTAVDARVNGGSWVALDKQDWGSWAKSFHVEAGSQVEFRATSQDGDQDTSETFTWLSDGSSFSASFEPRAQGNDWWVEVLVSANKPVAGVDGQVNGGTWTALDKTDWGTWAKSIHAPDGSSVQFRAHDTDGNTVTSQTYTWT